MANLTNSAKLIEEMNKKAYKTELPTVNNGTLKIKKNGTQVGNDFSANSATNVEIDLSIPTSASDVGALANTTKYGASLSLSMNSSTYVVTAQLKDQDGNNLGTAQTIDLPLESVVVSGSYNSSTKEVVLTLQGGSTVKFSVADLVSGLQTEINSSNKLSADLIADGATNKVVTATEKTTWNGKQDALTAGTNITISGNTISATDTTYTAGTGIGISGTTISNSGVTSFNGSTGAVTYTAPVTSVNGNTGAVTVNDVKQSASAPSSPTEGTVWYDTTNDVLKVYDGTNWNEVGGGNVIAMTQAEYDALSTATQNDGKLRIITDAPSIEMASKEYVDDLVGDIETLLAAL